MRRSCSSVLTERTLPQGMAVRQRNPDVRCEWALDGMYDCRG
jgi:hypothetical protein